MRTIFAVIMCVFAIHTSRPCTSAIIAGSLTKSGKPILWKNRDTSAADNKVEYIAASNPGELAYAGLFNASDKKCEQAWIGINEQGFAIMNTASYNLKDDKVSTSKMDREGYVMAHALKHCRTVDDFETLLLQLPKPLGVEANFGVIDADGNGAYFECNNRIFRRFNLADVPDGVLVRSNYSHSGRPDEGYGQIRECNALYLLDPYIKARSIEPYTLTDCLSCSFYHDLYGRDMSKCGERYLIDQDFIPRFTTTATVAIEDGVMWTALGYPPVAEVMPVWCAPDGVHPDLRGTEPDGTAKAGNRAKERKDKVFSVKDGNRNKYIDLSVLISPDGNGFLQVFRRQNRDTYNKFHR
ncbi:MAG: hypothetical protein NC402_05125 [Prevotella sp.]|nr:hypothetical protein [Prevotella sp.]MCM1074117.1 hypothetical protein [Ruminococcus sp.]